MPQYRYKMIRLLSHRKCLVVVFSRNPIKVFCVCRLPLFRPKFVSASAGMSFFREKWLLFGSKATVKGTNKQCEVISHRRRRRRRRRWRRQRRRRQNPSFVCRRRNKLIFFSRDLDRARNGRTLPAVCRNPSRLIACLCHLRICWKIFFL